MDRVIFLFLFSLTLKSQNASAQSDSTYNSGHYGHEISLGVGFFSHHEIVYKKEMYERQTKTINSYTGIWGIRYRRWLNNVALGGTVVYEQVSGDLTEWAHGLYVPPGTFRRDLWSFTGECMWAYGHTRDKPLRIYGYLNAGITYWNESDYQYGYRNHLTKFDGAAQFCPIGVSYGNRYRCFAELGYGIKGIVNVGASMQFGRSAGLIIY